MPQPKLQLCFVVAVALLRGCSACNIPQLHDCTAQYFIGFGTLCNQPERQTYGAALFNEKLALCGNATCGPTAACTTGPYAPYPPPNASQLPATTTSSLTAWDSSSGSSDVLAGDSLGSSVSSYGSLNDPSMQSDSSMPGHFTSGSSGSTQSGSSGSYLQTWQWVVIGVLLCCCKGAIIGALASMCGGKKKSSARRTRGIRQNEEGGEEYEGDESDDDDSGGLCGGSKKKKSRKNRPQPQYDELDVEEGEEE